MGTPAASAGSESPICERAGGSTTCSVDVLVCEAVVMGIGGSTVWGWLHWPLELAVNDQ